MLPLHPLHTGDTFLIQDWPLHITVLAPFLTTADTASLSEGIRVIAAGSTAITATVGPDALFGRRHTIPVSLVDDNADLNRLHERLIDAMRPRATAPDEPAFTGTEFRPHITAKPHGRVHRGDTVILSQIALVDMAPRADPNGRVVLATTELRTPDHNTTAHGTTGPSL